jgi:uncharacterized membrane protein
MHADRWLYAILGLGALLRFIHISVQSMWYDEGFTVMLLKRSVSDIWATNIRDVHPPLYYLVAHYWAALFGTSEFAIRSLSALFMIAAIAVAYFLVRRLFSVKAARLAALFMALGPYMIRYAQEARMYGMLTFLLLLATFFLVRAVQDKRRRDYIFYMLAMTLAIYSHYYTIFVAVVHFVYVLSAADLDRKQWLGPVQLFKASKAWIFSMVGLTILYLPWLPHAYEQFTKVDAGFWIKTPPIDMPARTIAQFMAFNDQETHLSNGGQILFMSDHTFSMVWHIVAYLGLLGLVGYLIRCNRKKQSEIIALSTFAFLPSILVFVWSFHRPIYLHRYFTFSAAAVYCLLGVMAFLKWGRKPLSTVARASYVVIIVLVLSWGIRDVYRGEDHKMRATAAHIAEQYQPGDEVISAELYTFFDLSYYMERNHLPQLKLLHNGENINGYGVTSLIYDRLDGILVENYQSVHPKSGFVWIVVQENKQQYIQGKKIPSNWLVASPRYKDGRIEVQRFRVL